MKIKTGRQHHFAGMAVVCLSVCADTVLAKGGGKAPGTDGSTNWLAILLIFTAIVLALVVWGLGQVVVVLGRQVLQKRKSTQALVAAGTIWMMLMGSVEAFAQQNQDEASATAVQIGNYGGLNQIEFWALSAVILIEVFVILFLAFMARRLHRELTGAADAALVRANQQPAWQTWWNTIDKKWMTRAVPVEREADILLDHDYDGIRELDNALPPWWKWGFYVTIVIGFIYLIHFHILGTGKSPEQEYAAEMAAGRRMDELYRARTKEIVDENNVGLADADGVLAGKKLYAQSCVACHGASGEGGIGPNLTDAYWLHGGSINDIYRTIKLGYPEKGMQAWQTVYSPMQMKQLSGFLHSIKGSKPANAKEPQGTVIEESGGTVVSDSAKQQVP